MSAKELKAIADIGITLGYSGDELKQFVNDEMMRMDKEKEQERQHKEVELLFNFFTLPPLLFLRGCVKRRKPK